MAARCAYPPSSPALHPAQARLLLLLQLLAELSADENSHDALVAARLVPALLPYAADAAAPTDVRMEAVVALSNLAENPATHEKVATPLIISPKP